MCLVFTGIPGESTVGDSGLCCCVHATYVFRSIINRLIAFNCICCYSLLSSRLSALLSLVISNERL